MKKSLSLIVGASMLLSAMPAFAEDASSSSMSSSSMSSVSSSVMSSSASSRSSASNKPCMNVTGLDKAACMLQVAKEKSEDRAGRQHRKTTLGHERQEACKDKNGLMKLFCMRQSMNKVEKKVEKIEKKIDNRIKKHVIKFNRRSMSSRSRKTYFSTSSTPTNSSSSSSAMSSASSN